MKKLLIPCIVVLGATCVMAAKRKDIKDVDTDAFTSDTQVTPKGAGDNHVALAWWIPKEFWMAILVRDKMTTQADKKAMLDALSDVSLLAVVQADITHFGAMQFYSKQEIETKMLLSYTDADDKKHRLTPTQTFNPDLEIVLGIFKPILSASMGNLGKNLHFYVLNDKQPSSARLLDPYLKGTINFNLTKRNGEHMTGDLEMPLNCLFIPRECPNGKNAHISWNYCPWTGKKLED